MAGVVIDRGHEVWAVARQGDEGGGRQVMGVSIIILTDGIPHPGLLGALMGAPGTVRGTGTGHQAGLLKYLVDRWPPGGRGAAGMPRCPPGANT